MNIKCRSILIVLVLLIIFSSCANLKLQSWENIDEIGMPKPENLWFKNQEQKALYKINIEAFQQKQGGMLIVKQDDLSSIRLLMVTEFGLKVFDVEYYKGDSLKLNYIMKHLDNPYIINALFDNFKVFWPNILTNVKTDYYHHERKTEYLYSLENGEEKWFYLYDNEKQLYEIQRIENGRKKSIINLDIQTKEILLKTKHPSIRIRLKKIDNAER